MDVSAKRLAALAPRAARAGITNVHAMVLGEDDARARASRASSTACWSTRRAAVLAHCGAIPT
jgi:16S rRNA C967 or C1407 C5-methylase (RsmB/RsmF family)